MDIIVLAGGLSSERDVSLKTGEMVAASLRRNGHRVILADVFMGVGEKEQELGDVFARADELTLKGGDIYDTAPDIEAVKASRTYHSEMFFGPNILRMCMNADIVFMALHGAQGENGKVQAAFDLLGIKYTGCDYLSSAIAMNKKMAKFVMESVFVPIPAGTSMKRSSRNDDIAALPVKLPFVVKPCSGGSSIGCSIVRDAKDYKKALDDAFSWDDEVLIEEFIDGREFSVSVVDGEALPVIEIAPKSGFYDYRNKYEAGSTVESCPADISPAQEAEMRRIARETAKGMGLDVYSRIDMRMDKNGRIVVLEANTLPGMTPTSLLPQEAAAVGVSFDELTEKIIQISLRKY